MSANTRAIGSKSAAVEALKECIFSPEVGGGFGQPRIGRGGEVGIDERRGNRQRRVGRKVPEALANLNSALSVGFPEAILGGQLPRNFSRVNDGSFGTQTRIQLMGCGLAAPLGVRGAERVVRARPPDRVHRVETRENQPGPKVERIRLNPAVEKVPGPVQPPRSRGGVTGGLELIQYPVDRAE